MWMMLTIFQTPFFLAQRCKVLQAREKRARATATLEGLNNRKRDLLEHLENNLNLNEKNLLFNYLSIFKKRINLYKFIKLFLLTFLLIPFSLILTFLEIVQLMKPSIIVYYFSKRVS